LRGARLHWLLAGVAVALAGLVYVNALDNPFVYDDRRLVVENRSLRDPLDLYAVAVHEATRPVVNLSYAIDRKVWGPKPFGFHVTNVLLHMITVALLFDFTRRTTGRRLAAFIAAALFAVHPMMTQAVGYISGRAELLCTMFFLLALDAARRWMLGPFSRPPGANSTRIAGQWAHVQRVARQSDVRTALGGPTRWLFATFALWILALASKETAAMFIVVALAYDRLVLPGTAPDRRRRLLWLHGPLLAFAMLAVALRLAVFTLIEHPGPIHADWNLGLLELDVVRRYLALLVRPSGQSIFHELAPVSGLLDPRFLSALGVIGMLGALGWWMRRVEGTVTFGIVWFLAAFVPLGALVVLGRGEPMAEQRVYLASCGLFLAFGAGIARLGAVLRWESRRTARLVFGTLLVAVLVVLSMHTVLRNAVWGDPVTLFTEATDAAPNSWLANLLLGEALHDAGRHDEAIGAFTTALQSNAGEPAIYTKLGVCLLEVGQLKGAAAMFQKVRELNPRSPEGVNGLGALALVENKPKEARSFYEQSLLYDPLNVPARLGLAKIEELEGNAAAALRRCEEIREIAPETPGYDECLSRNRPRPGGSGSASR
jgi:protein O-mannosyl-transferase